MKMIEARVLFETRVRPSKAPEDEVEQLRADLQWKAVGTITSMHETEEQARAWCRYLARLGNLIADRDVRGTLLAVEQDKGAP
jgi:hypothetical protein